MVIVETLENTEEYTEEDKISLKIHHPKKSTINVLIIVILSLFSLHLYVAQTSALLSKDPCPLVLAEVVTYVCPYLSWPQPVFPINSCGLPTSVLAIQFSWHCCWSPPAGGRGLYLCWWLLLPCWPGGGGWRCSPYNSPSQEWT